MQPPLPHEHPPTDDYASPESTFSQLSNGPASDVSTHPQSAYRPVRPLPSRYDNSSLGSQVSAEQQGSDRKEGEVEEEGSSVPFLDPTTPPSLPQVRPKRELTEQERITLTEIRRLTLIELRQIVQAPAPPPFSLNLASLAHMASMDFGLDPPTMEELEGLPPLDVLASMGREGVEAARRAGGPGAGAGAGDQTFASSNATFALSDAGEEGEEGEDDLVEGDEHYREEADGAGEGAAIFGSLERRSSSPVFYHHHMIPRHRSIGCQHQHMHAPGSACSAEGEEAEDGREGGEQHFRVPNQLDPGGRKDFALIEGLEAIGEKEMKSWRERGSVCKEEDSEFRISPAVGEEGQGWNEGAHPTSTSLPKKRKIPNNLSSSTSPPFSSPPRHSTHHPTNNRHTTTNSSSLQSSYSNFPTFPNIPKGFTRSPRPSPTSSSATFRSVHPNPSLVRASPACRAFLWAKSVWAERKRLLASRLCVDAEGNEGWLSTEEEIAVEFSGVVWGKGLDDGEGERGLALRAKRKKKGEGTAVGGMGRGVKEVLTKDGLGITAIVKEERWYGGGGRKKGPVTDLSDTVFDFSANCLATSFSIRTQLQLSILRNRLAILNTNLETASLKASTAEIEAASASITPRPRHSKASKKKNFSSTPPEESSDHPRRQAVSDVPATVATNLDEVSAPQISLPSTAPTEAGTGVAARKAARRSVAPQPVATQKLDVVETVEPPEERDERPSGGGKKKTGKKKRSALANAANPHHMKNYVPTRLLSEQPPPPSNPAALLTSFLFPPPSRFLSAQPRRYRSNPLYSAASNALSPSFNPSTSLSPSALSSSLPPSSSIYPDSTPSEYVCIFCDYALFYGPSEEKRKRATQKRKKMLARRRKAKERASGIAKGNGRKKSSSKDGENDGGEDAVGRVERDGEDEWDCDETMPDGQCRRCAERRERERKCKRKKRNRIANEPDFDHGLPSLSEVLDG